MKSLLIVPLVVLSVLSPVDAAPSKKYFSTSDCTGDSLNSIARPTVDECQNDVSTSEKQLAIEGGATFFRYEVHQNSAGGARGNCDGAANMTGYLVCGKCRGSAASRSTFSCDVAAGTVNSQQVCNDDCSVCANQTTYSLGECFNGGSTFPSLWLGSVWPESKYSAPGCGAANLTETNNRACNSCMAIGSAGDLVRSILWDCETAGLISAGASTSGASTSDTSTSGTSTSGTSTSVTNAVDAAPSTTSTKSFNTPDCTGDPSATVVRSPVGTCVSAEKQLAIEGGATLLGYEFRQNSAGGARGNCNGAANSTGYTICGKCEGSGSGNTYRTLTCDVAAGTFVTKNTCNADCSICASNTTYSLGDCMDGQTTPTVFATGSVWSTSKYSAPGCANADYTKTEYKVCNYCSASGSGSTLFDCETAGPGSDTTVAPGATTADGSTSASPEVFGSFASSTSGAATTYLSISIVMGLLVTMLLA